MVKENIMRLSAGNIRDAIERFRNDPGKEGFARDDTIRGFQLRMRKKAVGSPVSAVFYFQHKDGRTKIGRYGAITPEQARNGFRNGDIDVPGAAKLHAMVVNGINPSTVVRKAKAK